MLISSIAIFRKLLSKATTKSASVFMVKLHLDLTPINIHLFRLRCTFMRSKSNLADVDWHIMNSVHLLTRCFEAFAEKSDEEKNYCVFAMCVIHDVDRLVYKLSSCFLQNKLVFYCLSSDWFSIYFLLKEIGYNLHI